MIADIIVVGGCVYMLFVGWAGLSAYMDWCYLNMINESFQEDSLRWTHDETLANEDYEVEYHYCPVQEIESLDIMQKKGNDKITLEFKKSSRFILIKLLRANDERTLSRQKDYHCAHSIYTLVKIAMIKEKRRTYA